MLSFLGADLGEHIIGTFFKILTAFRVKSSQSHGLTPIPINFPFFCQLNTSLNFYLIFNVS